MRGLAPDTFLRRWLIKLAGDGAEIWQHSVSPWRSITFNGERHQLCLKLRSREQAERFTSAEMEIIPVPGALVVDASVAGLVCGDEHCWLYLELLTLSRSADDAGATTRLRPSIKRQAEALVA